MNKEIQLLSNLMKQDPLRLEALECLRLLNLPQSYIAAGFVRNLVWDYLHKKTVATHLNDIDVIYFDLDESSADKCKDYQHTLHTMMPQVNWQVRNQALMHSRNGDQPYKNILDAMSYWPEKETAVAIRKLATGEFEAIAAFGFDSLFNLQITHNSKRDKSIFTKRVTSKNWLELWPKLSINTDGDS